MREELINFVLEKGLSPFDSGRNLVAGGGGSIYKTRDARAVHTRVLNRISSGFVFDESSNIWNFFGFVSDFKEIKKRQEFFKSLNSKDGKFFKKLERPRVSWKPRYDVVVVTEDESTFVRMKDLSCGVQLLTSESDVMDLERYDVVQVVDCSDFKMLLERLPQSVFLKSVDDVYLERYLEELSGWRGNFALLNGGEVSDGIRVLLDELAPMFALLENREGKIISESEVERVLEGMNERIGNAIKMMTISGEGLMEMLAEGKMPSGILDIVKNVVENSGLPEHIFNLQIPVTIDYKELEDQIKRKSAMEFTDIAERVKGAATELKRVPGILKRLEAEILVEDFCNGVCCYIDGGGQIIDSSLVYPSISENLYFSGAKNMFLDNGRRIDFQLDSFSKCSILTGANSGGKTTLLEHVLQNISLFQLGLPVNGEVHMPMFSDVYYFAKTKGSTSKGAFETLLMQMSKIVYGEVIGKTLILADEIEAVTEPGVAGKIISATAEYFVKKGCYLILATHLGAEIAKNLGDGMRIDGIEAKGLDEDFNLIVDHNPIMGRLASSTPELIVEKMACSSDSEYFKYLFNRVKG
jgi:DNA mismatch repair protein MutS2